GREASLGVVGFLFRRFLFLFRFDSGRRQGRRQWRQFFWRHGRGARAGRFLLLLRLFLLFGEEVLPLFQQRIDRPLGNQIGPFLERLLLFQLLLELGRFFLELLAQHFFVFVLFVLARRPFLRHVRRDVHAASGIFVVGR